MNCFANSSNTPFWIFNVENLTSKTLTTQN